jgi:putrescine transport system ATP-binding protein
VTGLLAVEGVTKRFGASLALDDVSLTVASGEFFALLGPSGCGKTTLLRTIAGFETPDSGRIVLDGADITRERPYRRPLNMVFQSYALFPHLSVFENVAYGLKSAKVGRGEIRERVTENLAAVRLAGFEDRRTHELSGGERQRVALARALALRPRMLLLDEPLSALDRQIRAQVQLELKELQHRLDTTFVIVTHDQEEALALGDRIAVMCDGRIAQVGAPRDLYDRPESEFVAGFLGEATILRGRLEAAAAGTRLVLPTGERLRLAFDLNGSVPGRTAALVLRPEDLEICAGAPAEAGDRNTLSGQLLSATFLGSSVKHVVSLPSGARIQVRTSPDAAHDAAVGAQVSVRWLANRGSLVDESEST